MAAYRVLDIETIPDPSAYTPNAPRWVLTAGPESPGRMAVQAGCGDDAFGPPSFIANVVQEDAFPPPQAQRVVAISWVDLSSNDNEWYFADGYKSMCEFSGDAEAAENKLLSAFAEAQMGDGACLVTWNGRTFDMPVLNLRSFRHGIAWPWYYNDRDVRYRYSEAGHCDLMDVLSDYGAVRSLKLGDAARLIGLPGKFGPVAGNNVHLQIQACAGKSEEEILKVAEGIARYCLSDSVQTAVLYARHRMHRGVLKVSEYNRAVDSFKEMFSEGVFEDGFDWERLKVKA